MRSSPDKKDPWMPEIDPNKMPPPDEIKRRIDKERKKKMPEDNPQPTIDAPMHDPTPPPTPEKPPTENNQQTWKM